MRRDFESQPLQSSDGLNGRSIHDRRGPSRRARLLIATLMLATGIGGAGPLQAQKRPPAEGQLNAPPPHGVLPDDASRDGLSIGRSKDGTSAAAIAGRPDQHWAVTEKANDSMTGIDRQQQQQDIVPFLESFCGDCHIDGAEEGGVRLDDLMTDRRDADTIKLWDRVAQQMRLELMPPVDIDPPSQEQRDQVLGWVKNSVFQIDPQNPHPGRRVIGRLNRVQYRNTIRDLMGYEIDTRLLFPPDDTGHGFDNIGDVLTLSPLLMEKYINAATEIVSNTVPQVGHVAKSKGIDGTQFSLFGDAKLNKDSQPQFDYHTGGRATLAFKIEQAADYRVEIEIVATETRVENAVDKNRCHVRIVCDGELLLDAPLKREKGQTIPLELERTWEPGTYALEMTVTPKNKSASTRELRVFVKQTRIVGPLNLPETFRRPKNHDRFFEPTVAQTDRQKRQSARRLLGRFASQAYRRPVEADTLERLVNLAAWQWSTDSGSFETGISQAMIAVLSSPSFLFKETVAEQSDDPFPQIDEYSLATRLSYFLWSTMPDQRLLELAGQGKLRTHLDQEIERMLADQKFDAFYENFIGQWLLTRDVKNVSINAFAVTKNSQQANQERSLKREIEAIRESRDQLSDKQIDQLRGIFWRLRKLQRSAKAHELTAALRDAMQRETEMMFQHLIKNDRDMIELLDSDYTFVNETLAKHYSIAGVKGNQMRKVALKPEHQRGSLLAHGSLLTVTSNPDRTSPVKRGLFIMDNLLGMPTGAAPPDIPSLDAAGGEDHDSLTLRQSLALHREDPNCSSCHNRMDPLGLALENFDALGRYRTHDGGGEGEPVDASGTLITGEYFENVQQLKKILSKNHRDKFYRCLTEKMTTYALGRAIDYRDTHTIDQIVDQLSCSGGTARSLFKAIIHSPGFQRTTK